MNEANTSKLQPILLAGTALGLVSAIPPLSCINVCCCAGVIGGGALAVYLYLRKAPPVTGPPYGDGALLGVGAGAFGAVVATVVGIPVQLIVNSLGFSGDQQTQQMREGLEKLNVPEFVQEMLVQLSSPGLTLAKVLMSFAMGLVTYSIFGAIGGLIGAAVFTKKGKPEVPPPPPPPMPMAVSE
jgi:hypothetical protein